MPHTLDFKTVLITGGAGGIGKALAIELISRGKKVLIAGRTESSLKATTSEIGAAGYYLLDTGNTSSIPAFIDTILRDHPELDCLINNAGVQRPFEVLGEYEFDLAKADAEIDINIRGPLHLCVGLIQRQFAHLPSAVIMNVSSVLGFVPFSRINPVYNGTKAWLHSFTVNLRTQLEYAEKHHQKGAIKVVEIVPPQVESDLHRERVDPDDNKKHKGANALTMVEFMEAVRAGWEKDSDVISAGPGEQVVKDWHEVMGAKYDKLVQ